jgi:hypothetical protein
MGRSSSRFAEWKLGMNIEDVSPLREIPKLKAPLYLIGGDPIRWLRPAALVSFTMRRRAKRICG